jgi:hypothetical protein
MGELPKLTSYVPGSQVKDLRVGDKLYRLNIFDTVTMTIP